MTSNTKILKQTIELLTGELKQAGEYRDNAVRCGVELNKQLAAMTARAELAERQTTRIQDERAASFARLDAAVGGTGLTEYQPEVDTLIECAIKGIIAAKELAERQVKLLCGHIDDYGSCWNCPAKTLGAACSHSGESCRERLAAWARAEAVKEGGKG